MKKKNINKKELADRIADQESLRAIQQSSLENPKDKSLSNCFQQSFSEMSTKSQYIQMMSDNKQDPEFAHKIRDILIGGLSPREQIQINDRDREIQQSYQEEMCAKEESKSKLATKIQTREYSAEEITSEYRRRIQRIVKDAHYLLASNQSGREFFHQNFDGLLLPGKKARVELVENRVDKLGQKLDRRQKHYQEILANQDSSKLWQQIRENRDQLLLMIRAETQLRNGYIKILAPKKRKENQECILSVESVNKIQKINLNKEFAEIIKEGYEEYREVPDCLLEEVFGSCPIEIETSLRQSYYSQMLNPKPEQCQSALVRKETPVSIETAKPKSAQIRLSDITEVAGALRIKHHIIGDHEPKEAYREFISEFIQVAVAINQDTNTDRSNFNKLCNSENLMLTVRQRSSLNQLATKTNQSFLLIANTPAPRAGELLSLPQLVELEKKLYYFLQCSEREARHRTDVYLSLKEDDRK